MPCNSFSNSEEADEVFGVITVVMGILGTIFGGAAMDHAGASIRNAFCAMAMFCLIGCAFALIAFLSAKEMYSFLATFAVAEFFIFAVQVCALAWPILYVDAALRL